MDGEGTFSDLGCLLFELHTFTWWSYPQMATPQWCCTLQSGGWQQVFPTATAPAKQCSGVAFCTAWSDQTVVKHFGLEDGPSRTGVTSLVEHLHRVASCVSSRKTQCEVDTTPSARSSWTSPKKVGDWFHQSTKFLLVYQTYE